MVQHVRGVTGRCFYQLRQIRAIRKSLTVETSKLLIHAFVNSRLDYCNSVLQGVGAVHLQKLQLIQNGAARVVARKRKFDPIMSTIRDELHWLPVVQRIHFKQCMLVYRSLHGMASADIIDMCVKRTFDSEHYLRSAVHGELVVPPARKATLGRRSFTYSGPSLWNALPHDIRDPCLTFSLFRNRLKTLLYREAYNLKLQALSWWLRHKGTLYKCRYLLTYIPASSLPFSSHFPPRPNTTPSVSHDLHLVPIQFTSLYIPFPSSPSQNRSLCDLTLSLCFTSSLRPSVFPKPTVNRAYGRPPFLIPNNVNFSSAWFTKFYCFL